MCNQIITAAAAAASAATATMPASQPTMAIVVAAAAAATLELSIGGRTTFFGHIDRLIVSMPATYLHVIWSAAVLMYRKKNSIQFMIITCYCWT